MSSPERALSEHFNHSGRRLRMAESRGEWAAILRDAAARFAAKTVVFTSEDVAVWKAPAFASAVELRDTVVTLRDESQLGPAVQKLGEALHARCYLFPIVDKGSVTAILYAEDRGQPDRNALELLAMLASGTMPAGPDSEPPPPVPALVQIAGLAIPAPARIPEPDQALHLKAQRYARVHIAQMLIDQYDAVEHGRRNRALYVYLKEPLEGQRQEFRRLYLDTCASMTDYYHEELVRTLANNDAELLGPQYPGPQR